MSNWLLGTATVVMGVGGLFVSSRAGHGVGYYGGLGFFLFSLLFVFLLIKTGFDHGEKAPSFAQLRALFVGTSGLPRHAGGDRSGARPAVRAIGVAEVRDALARGIADFNAQPTHLIFLCAIYPIVGVMLARMTFGYDVLPILFPLIAGFSLIGPLAATGLYELSRRRELGLDFAWWHVFDVLRSPSIGALGALGVVLAVIFLAWLGAAQAIFHLTFGSWVPASVGEFARQVFTTPAGWTLIVVGCGVGFVFAVVALAISVVSLPMLLDRDVGAARAVRTSVAAVRASPRAMALWGLIVVGALVAGAVPFFVGLAVVLPVLGHATWHLYRQAVPR